MVNSTKNLSEKFQETWGPFWKFQNFWSKLKILGGLNEKKNLKLLAKLEIQGDGVKS